jgi:UDP-2-acetamido-2,6-beta-L-arabino-hexul-4-ose reductase
VKRIFITGGRGFLGRNLAAHLLQQPAYEISIFDQEDSAENLRAWLGGADLVFHLAGINRPQDPLDFERGNVGLTEQMCEFLRERGLAPKIVFSSSVQAELDNPYGVSKRRAEDVLRKFGRETGACIRIYRLKNLFGKWCRPNYNSVTATFCHNIGRDLPISISDPAREVELSYVDDVVAAFLTETEEHPCSDGDLAGEQIRSHRIQLGELAGRIQAFHEMRTTLLAPDFSDWFNRALYATYLSHLPSEARLKQLSIKSDARGSLAEFIKQDHFGQIFVSRTKPGVTRGNHYHHTKAEKFFVVEGKGLIRMRAIEGGLVQEYCVQGSEYQVVDIPPGFTHSITNVGTGEMVTLFWSSEVFDPDRPDTYYLSVDSDEQSKSVRPERA